jgi:hypothetical protein
MGLTVSDAFRLMMVRIAKDKALPFEPLVPNAETIEAMKAARRSDLVVVGAPDKLLGNPTRTLRSQPDAGCRWWPRQSGTVNSSLTLRPRALG